MQLTNARFATTHDRINEAYLLIIGYRFLNGEWRDMPTTNFRYLKKKGIESNALAGRQGPPKKMSSVDLVSRNFDHIPTDRGDTPASALVFTHAAANTIPDMTLAKKLYANITIAPE